MAGLAGVLGGDDERELKGELLIDGTNARHSRGRSTLVLQHPDAQTILERVGDDTAFGCENLNLPKNEIWSRVRSSLDIVGLGYMILDRSTRRLSGGQRQRLASAGVLATHPGLLLLHEPTANLDPQGVKELHDAVRGVLDRTHETLVVVEHHIDVWLDLGGSCHSAWQAGIPFACQRSHRRRQSGRSVSQHGAGIDKRARLGSGAQSKAIFRIQSIVGKCCSANRGSQLRT